MPSIPPIYTLRRCLFMLALIFLVMLTGCMQGKPWQPLPPPEGPATMRPDTAYSLYLAWKKHVGSVAYHAKGVRMQPDGSFIAIYGALDFDYSAEHKTLKVMKVLGRGNVAPYEETDPGPVRMRRLAKLEPWTLGGGHFYINPHPWITDGEQVRWPNMNTYTLMRQFTSDHIRPKRFVVELRWLVFWAEYWRPNVAPLPGIKESGTNRAKRTPEEQAATRPALKKWAMKILSRPEPPDVHSPF